MLKEKKSTLKPVKKAQEDSSSEEQRVRQKKFGDSSSSEIPKRTKYETKMPYDQTKICKRSCRRR